MQNNINIQKVLIHFMLVLVLSSVFFFEGCIDSW